MWNSCFIIYWVWKCFYWFEKVTFLSLHSICFQTYSYIYSKELLSFPLSFNNCVLNYWCVPRIEGGKKIRYGPLPSWSQIHHFIKMWFLIHLLTFILPLESPWPRETIMLRWSLSWNNSLRWCVAFILAFLNFKELYKWI